MGRIVCLECENGDYRKTLRIGTGQKESEKDNIINFFATAHHPAIHLAYEKDSGYSFSHYPAFCRACSDYITAPVFETMVGSYSDRFIGKTDCGDKPDDIQLIYNIDTEELLCPICKGRLTPKTQGYWE